MNIIIHWLKSNRIATTLFPSQLTNFLQLWGPYKDIINIK